MSNGSTLPGTLSTPAQAYPSLQVSGQDDTTATIPRSASYTQLPADAKVDATPERKSSLSRSFSENVLVNIQGNVSSQSSAKKRSEDASKARRGSLRRLGSSKRQKDSDTQFTISKFTIGPDPSSEDLAEESKVRKDGTTQGTERKAPSVAGSISSLARKSWISKSRSPSPSPTKSRLRKETGPAAESTHQINGSSPAVDVKTSSLSAAEVKDDAPNLPSNIHAKGSLSRRNSVLTRSRRPLSSLLSKASPSEIPSVPPIPKSYSTDRLPLSSKQSTSSKTPTVPSSWSSERLQGLPAETPRRKDELWSVFRTLDGEYQKFQSRPSTMKTSIVRSVLLPFLRNHAEHPSSSSLRPEDLDRRTFILNKWWTGLLEMLNGRHGESVSGNDRPAILEAVTALMARPEWTLPLSSIATRPTRTTRTSLKSQSTTSLGSNISDFLADSVHHNVRNTFTQNLLAQMAYVVDKMSTRNVAASVVTFCGKATAYAFFYCEGIAEILVRLWAIPSETLRRVLAKGSTQKQPEIDSVSHRVCTAYPQCLHSLKLKALRPMMKYLRSKPQSPLPIATTLIPWHGPWVSRWAGKDTDLFFVFTKFYTDLACRFLPDHPSPEERMAAPAWVLVQAQILTILDATMQQMNSQTSISPAGPSVTFDDLLGEADANATMLPVPAHGVVRTMGENRLIMLLRECLSSSTIIAAKSRSIFAQAFSSLLEVAARRTSMYDHNACFTLCDFLEEAILILLRYQQETDAAIAVVNWSFWLDVCRHMLQSQNSMTEVRLCAFLYSMWSAITSDEARRREVCLDWLLAEDTFHANFNHWCPMVRAFYMRLIVWKIARLNVSGSDVNIAILGALDHRLRQVYRIFLYIQENARRKHLAAPSTAPCSPAPGRCLEIVRNDSHMAPGGSFLTFDAILSSASSTRTSPYQSHNAQELASPSNASQPSKGIEDTDKSQDGGKKRWSLFKSIIPSSSPKDRPKTSSAKSTLAASQSSPPPRHGSAEGSASKTAMNGTAGPAPSYRTLSFKISLEWIDQDINNPAGRDRRLYPPKLPLPAQLSLQTRQSEDTRDNSPLEPLGVTAGPSKYAGRALAEWAILITECQNFFERRKAEGVPSYQLVETPTLGVDPFRKVHV